MCSSSSSPSLYMLTLPGSVSTDTAHEVTNDLGAATSKVSTVLNSPSGRLLSRAWFSSGVPGFPVSLLSPRLLH